MKKTFFKNLFRDIKKSISRFLSIVIIIAIGVAFYAGVRATSPDMKISADYYFNNNNFMDFKLISTLGITEDDIEAIEKLKGISKAEGSYSIDGVIEKNNHSIVVNINSLPDKNSMNRINITEGRTIKSDKEVIVEERFLKEYKLNIGDIIVIKSGNKSNIKDNLKNDSFKIVGTAQSPLYISAQRQISSVGDGDVKGFIYILPEVFKNDVYTEMYVRCNNKESRYSLLKNEEYKNIMTEMEKQLKYAGIERNKIRYIQVLKNAEDKIDEAENKLVISRKEVENKVLQGRSKIEEARDKLNQGKVEFEKNESDFNKKISDAEKQISQGKVNIKIAKENIDLKDREIENGNIEIKKAKDKISHSENKLMESKLQAENRILKQMKAKLEKAKNNKDSMPFNPLYIREYNSIYNIYKNIKGKDFDSIYTNLNDSGFIDIFNGYFDIKVLKANFDKAALDISKGKQQIFTREQLLKEGEIKLKKGKSDVEVNKKRLSALEVKLDKKKKDGIARLSKEKINIKDSEKAINENIEKLNAEELKANSQLKLAEIEIQNNREKLKHIKNPQWYVLGRAFNIGYESFRQDSDRIDNIGKAFPLIFFLVAALVSLTTMTRMVQEKRIEIGTFKALGYSRLAIVSHYLIYSSLASIIGSIIGISFGFRLFPPLIMNAYGSLYTIPHYLTPFNANLALKASLIAIIFTTLASIGAALSELREVPALLMRPKPPKAGKTILAEKMSFLWKRLSFTKKVTARNIFRYKQRFFMTVIGIAACTGLIITGFALKEGIIGAMYKQFNEIYKYDMQINLNDYVDSEKKKNIYNSIIKKLI
ncbi:FtsX-like permease family protein [Clostridium pasteurianum]|uniref:FtsX-like permease family protein n=1 Tax=Clostridium pasteurianum TaxID=1501 RepID=UPI001FA850FF|nr:FtsX-like permease family protein [Clostridium pasteurianum]